MLTQKHMQFKADQCERLTAYRSTLTENNDQSRRRRAQRRRRKRRKMWRESFAPSMVFMMMGCNYAPSIRFLFVRFIRNTHSSVVARMRRSLRSLAAAAIFAEKWNK